MPVTLRVVGGTATLGVDYTTPSGTNQFTVNIPAGRYSGTGNIATGINIINEALLETGETIILEIVPNTGRYNIANTRTCGANPTSRTTHTIVDDEAEIFILKALPNGRMAPRDQFTLSIINANGGVLSRVNTTGANNQVAGQARTVLGNLPVDGTGRRYQISEVMAPGSTSPLAAYGSQLSCTNSKNGSATPMPSGRMTAAGLVPRAGDRIRCTFTNSFTAVTIVQALKTGRFNDRNGNGLSDPGETITYVYRVLNAGNVTLNQVSVAESRAVFTGSGVLPVPVWASSTRGSAAGSLLPGEEATYTATYQLTQQDIDAGSVHNQILARGVSFNRPAVTDLSHPTNRIADAPTVVRLAVARRLAVDKRANVTKMSAPGRISYRIDVTNTGNVGFPQAGVVVGDTVSTPTGQVELRPVLQNPNTGDVNRNGRLDPRESWIYTAFYDVTQADFDAGDEVINTARAGVPNGPNQVPPVVSREVPVALVTEPGLAVEKRADVTEMRAPGRISYQIDVTNTGNDSFPQAGVVVGDTVSTPTGQVELTPELESPNTGDVNGDGRLDPGETWIYTTFYDVTQADIDAGDEVINIARAGVPEGPKPVPPVESPEVPVALVTEPGLAVEKRADVTEMRGPGRISYQIDVANTGNVSFPQAGVVVGDTVTTPTGPVELTPELESPNTGDVNGNGRLDPRETWIYTAFYDVTQADIDAGDEVINIARAGVPEGPKPVPPVESPEVPVTLVTEPGLAVEKRADVTEMRAPGRISYQIDVANTGNVSFPQAGVVVGDTVTTPTGPVELTPELESPNTGDVNGNGRLDPRETWIYTTFYDVTQADIDAGDEVINIARAGVPEGPKPVPPVESPEVPVTLVPEPGLAVDKRADVTEIRGPGRISYQIDVGNTGNVSFAGEEVVVSDTLSTPNGPVELTPELESPNTGDVNGNGRLDPRETWIYTTFYDVTQADIDAGGEITNTARAGVPDGTNPVPPVVSPEVPVTLVPEPGLAVDKRADVTEIRGPGRISYQIDVENTGNVSFAGEEVVVSDTLSTPNGPVELTPELQSPNSGDVNGNGRLDPRETWIYTAFYDVTQADIDAGGEITNTARAGVPDGTNPVPPVVSPEVPVTLVPEPGEFVIEKFADVQTALVGDLIPYRIVIRNLGGRRAQVRVTDSLPVGFVYRIGTARLDGEPVSPEVTGRSVVLDDVSIAGGQSRELVLQVLVSSSVRPGKHTNWARLTDPRTGEELAPPAPAVVRVLADAVMQCSTVLGRVFNDTDQNGHMSRAEEERGLPNVRLIAPNGLSILTDEYGRFNVPCAAMPQAIGSNFMLRLDERTLPSGYRLTTENPRVVRLTQGMITRMDFGANLAPLVRIDLAAGGFVSGPDGTSLKPELQAGLQKLVAQIRKQVVMLRITYQLADDEPAPVARHRIRLVEKVLRQMWRATGHSKLNIETRIERTGVRQ
ncbi:DUF7507 domain-containing protein [Pseudogemmobacter faecipullorum]|uniref:DUF11 domain-containing protein n=1 Tax=Pseudogemmobacter faecipullorum TaxID=2755041 RepID=A0ABS8CPH9_9RHOB|nr:DUF11 domain-containing protein [Pseudogemmobacter faecipullorum]MCB5411306.1 DUF11 domain-containing protein [Pseudogemmobacter faecipullorum]